MKPRKCCKTEKGQPHEKGCQTIGDEIRRQRNIRRKQKADSKLPPPTIATKEESTPDWSRKCIVCGQKPIVPIAKMCGPCTFGEADTVGGNW